MPFGRTLPTLRAGATLGGEDCEGDIEVPVHSQVMLMVRKVEMLNTGYSALTLSLTYVRKVEMLNTDYSALTLSITYLELT